MTTNRLLVSGWLVAEDRDTPYDGSTKTDNPLRERTKIRVWLLTADVRLATRSGVQVTATLPDVTRSAVVTRPTGEVFNFSENFSGLGDTSVIAWHRLPVRRGWNVTLNAGASLPTGKTETPKFRRDLSEGSLVPLSRLQRGTGTIDPLFGASVNRVFTGIIPPGVRVFASAAARVPVSESKYGLRTGASWEAGIGGSREVKWESLIAIVRAGWLHREQDVFEGTPVLVGGGDWITLAPSVAVVFKGVTAQVELKVPLWRSLSNRQLDSARMLQVGVMKAF
ncbi:MAG: hypothetical protein M3R55_12800 [Acidobacteriota bacterium]|nr:hypothetical protein [Acidobacteriota bacterium]MDQ3169792.1 hypothetical protein [Acidobacteriota bacterium]